MRFIDKHNLYTYFTLNYFYLLFLINCIVLLNRELIRDYGQKEHKEVQFVGIKA